MLICILNRYTEYFLGTNPIIKKANNYSYLYVQRLRSREELMSQFINKNYVAN